TPSRCGRSATRSRTSRSTARASEPEADARRMSGTDGRGHRVVVTGLGVVSAVGNDVSSTWQALLAGRSGGARISLFDATEDFPTRIAAEVKGFDPSLYLDSKEARRYDRYSQFALAASEQAMRD